MWGLWWWVILTNIKLSTHCYLINVYLYLYFIWICILFECVFVFVFTSWVDNLTVVIISNIKLFSHCHLINTLRKPTLRYCNYFSKNNFPHSLTYLYLRFTSWVDNLTESYFCSKLSRRRVTTFNNLFWRYNLKLVFTKLNNILEQQNIQTKAHSNDI